MVGGLLVIACGLGGIGFDAQTLAVKKPQIAGGFPITSAKGLFPVLAGPGIVSFAIGLNSGFERSLCTKSGGYHQQTR